MCILCTDFMIDSQQLNEDTFSKVVRNFFQKMLF